MLFGIGGTTTMHITFFTGINSIDSAGWEKRQLMALFNFLELVTGSYLKKPHNRKLKLFPQLSLDAIFLAILYDFLFLHNFLKSSISASARFLRLLIIPLSTNFLLNS
ncbi:MAG: hypothetical protein QXO96_06040 [Sulfolobales archaeon]